MKIICWNVHGLGGPRAARRLQFLLKQYKSQMHMERIRRRCGFENGINVGAEGSRGGISMAWKAGITTRFYGSPYVTNKDVSWNLLRRLG
ncbi:hypothetical protein V6Z11_A10G237600 [Gossypium hirsutum]